MRTVQNTATLAYQSEPGTTIATGVGPDVTVPAFTDACNRVVTICKLITQNNDGIADNIASLTFGVTGNTKSATNSVTVSNVGRGQRGRLREHHGAAGRQPHGY